jgi:hypothetical protein
MGHINCIYYTISWFTMNNMKDDTVYESGINIGFETKIKCLICKTDIS